VRIKIRLSFTALTLLDFEENFCVGFYVVLVLEIKSGLTSTSSEGSPVG
jgi:hypothetical protein